MRAGVLVAWILGLTALCIGSAPADAIPYPEGWRSWVHVKSELRVPGAPDAPPLEGLHHIYANEKALEGYRSGTFPDGSVIVLDLLEAPAKGGVTAEGNRRGLFVMVKDGKQFSDTGGWGFEEFRGNSRTDRAVGANAKTACLNCHANRTNRDYVLSSVHGKLPGSGSPMAPFWWSLGFFLLNVLSLRGIVWRKRATKSPPRDASHPPGPLTEGFKADPLEVLGWEYEYARTTASEALQDRQAMINFYLILVGVVASGVLANLDKLDSWDGAATLLLWLVCAVGWLHFLILVRLREAWHDSAKTMLQVRDFCIQHAKDIDSGILREAFRWRKETLPAADKPWSHFFYSALLIGFVDSTAFTIGGYLLAVEQRAVSAASISGLVGMGLLLFAFHIYVYFALLKKQGPNSTGKTHMVKKKTSSNPEGLSVAVIEEREEYRFKNLFKVVKAVLHYSTFSDGMSEPVVRLNFERGESVGILLYDPDRDSVVLVRQFRYPVYASLSDEEKKSAPHKAWILEIVAGVKESHLEVAQVATKELLEEAGYEVKGEPRKIATIYPSPGGTSERITVFLGIADSESPVGEGGGVVSEGEDTQVIVLPFEKALEAVEQGEIQDAKTIIALQYLARINRAALR